MFALVTVLGALFLVTSGDFYCRTCHTAFPSRTAYLTHHCQGA